ncbi:antibiotic biosynthesis monooxygenase [Halobacillus litoralis]|uniref:putative quinol monooxygenase n=1 Tax=Halobacillus litoralis TaxID=45668 RepID=UPI001CD770B1|nr:putative quinol monooxygenase [Halobacillus litoralis]MCA0970490.1 antibiotic biosynthesis monooxygenase [Halobacillus litoralis]
MKYGLYGKLVAAEGKRTQLAEIMTNVASFMNEVEGCELYIVNQTDEEPDAICVFEVWKDAEAHQSSLSLETTRNLIAQAKPILEDVQRIHTLETVAGKGIN